MFETQNMEAGDIARSTGEINIAKLRSALDLCLEELPNLLELGNCSDMIGVDYDFPYHRPSVISMATVASSQMPETLGYCLLQVRGRHIRYM
jgi:dynein heavy chain